MNVSRIRISQVLSALVLLGLLSLLVPAGLIYAGGEPDSKPAGQSGAKCSGYYYTVKLGDTWSKISRRVGQPVTTLKAANPKAVRARDLIYASEQLCIPSAGGAEQGGYWYQVRPGDTWRSVSRRTGVPVETLWEANPRLVNKLLWLYIGQTVWVPALPNGVTPAPTQVPVAPEAPAVPPPSPTLVQPSEPVVVGPTPTAVPTDTPTTLPTATAVPPTATAVPTSVPSATPVATATPTSAPTTTATPSPLPPMPTAGIPEPTSAPTSAPASGAELPTQTAIPSPVPPTATAQPTAVLPPIPADCPKSLVAYSGTVADYLNKAGNTPDSLRNWLILCRTADAKARAVTVAPITAPKSTDVIVALRDPAGDPVQAKGTLLVYHKGAKGYALAHKHDGQGRMGLIQAADINTDGKFDIVYSETSCSAHTCFGTLFVDSWDGKAYQDWITDEPTMAYPEYSIKDVTPDGQGNEILIHGGVIGSVGAGPQRAWTETYISPKGGTYVLASQVYDPSTCLYHKIVDANRAFDAWALEGFEPAIEAYKAAIADTAATACGTIKDEVAILGDFARFRLVVADIAAGHASDIGPLPTLIVNKPLAGAAATFLQSYKDNTSVIQACRDTTKYAEANPASWQFLADWGYANPSFTAQDLCPLN